MPPRLLVFVRFQDPALPAEFGRRKRRVLSNSTLSNTTAVPSRSEIPTLAPPSEILHRLHTQKALSCLPQG